MASRVAHIPTVELDLRARVELADVVLLLLVAREDADLPDVGRLKTSQHGVPEGSSAADDEKGLVL